MSSLLSNHHVQPISSSSVWLLTNRKPSFFFPIFKNYCYSEKMCQTVHINTFLFGECVSTFHYYSSTGGKGTVLPCLLVEKEIALFQDGGQIKRENDIYHHAPRPISITCHLPAPPYFSLVTTFKCPSYVPMSYIHFICMVFFNLILKKGYCLHPH